MQCCRTESSISLHQIPVSGRKGEGKVNSICMETQYKTSTCQIFLLLAASITLPDDCVQRTAHIYYSKRSIITLASPNILIKGRENPYSV